jgi:hypothetical protein
LLALGSGHGGDDLAADELVHRGLGDPVEGVVLVAHHRNAGQSAHALYYSRLHSAPTPARQVRHHGEQDRHCGAGDHMRHAQAVPGHEDPGEREGGRRRAPRSKPCFCPASAAAAEAQDGVFLLALASNFSRCSLPVTVHLIGQIGSRSFSGMKATRIMSGILR